MTRIAKRLRKIFQEEDLNEDDIQLAKSVVYANIAKLKTQRDFYAKVGDHKKRDELSEELEALKRLQAEADLLSGFMDEGE